MDIENPFSILSELKFDDHYDPHEEHNDEEEKKSVNLSGFAVRIWLEKKHRNGKPVSLITGIDLPPEKLKDLAKKIKSKMGAGGSVSENQILIQTQNRDQLITILKNEGFKDIKKAGG